MSAKDRVSDVTICSKIGWLKNSTLDTLVSHFYSYVVDWKNKNTGKCKHVKVSNTSLITVLNFEIPYMLCLNMSLEVCLH